MSIESTKSLQNNIFLLNESCNKRKLKLDKNVTDKLFDLKNELILFFNKLSQESFLTSNDVLHPNLISFLIRNNICTINKNYCTYKKKIVCYLQSIHTVNDLNVNVYISKQIYFGYHFIEKLKKYSKKNFMKNFFDDQDYIINLKMEEWSRSWNGVKNTRRLDFVLDIGNDRHIVIEYLEDHHINELKDWNLYQSIRLVDILFGSMKDTIVHFAFFWDKNYDSKYIKKKAKYISNIIKDFHNIDNEKEYTISLLNKEIKNKSFSTILYESYFDENKPIVNIDKLLSSIFPSFKKDRVEQFKDKFISTSNQLNDTSDLFDEFDSESDGESYTDEKIIYYSINNKNIQLSNHGLSLFLNLCNIDDFDNINDFRSGINFINKIAKSAYTSAIKIRELITKQKENVISGLNEI
jgi:hypothetical protein